VTDFRRAREADDADARVGGESLADGGVASDQLYGADWGTDASSDLAKCVHQPERGERSGWRGLHDDWTAGGDSRAQFVRGEQQRVIETSYSDDDADRLPLPEPGHTVSGRQQVERHGFAVQSGDFIGARLESDQCSCHFDSAVAQRLAGLEHEKALEFFSSRRDECVRISQPLAAHA